MSNSIMNILLAILGLSFLVFIHELAHFFVARWKKIRVEVFSIGMGKPIFFWNHKGVRWQVCFILFGGYVKLAGQGDEKDVDPRMIKDGFFAKTPWQRLQVAAAGPIINIIFAFVAFSLIWMYGGREQSFSEHTKLIGWVDPKSELFEKGIRPGDIIHRYDQKPYCGFKDLIYNSVAGGKATEIAGEKIDYYTEAKTPFSYNLEGYVHPNYGKDFQTIGVLSPATLLQFRGFDPQTELEAPLYKSGIQKGDYVVWADGQILFSPTCLQYIVNRNTALLTVERDGKKHLVRVPRVYLADLAVSHEERQEILDAKHEAKVPGASSTFITIPYELDVDLTIKKPLGLVNAPLILQEKAGIFEVALDQSMDAPLKPGDKIVGIYGEPVSSLFDFMNKIQKRKVVLMVNRQSASLHFTTQNQDEIFLHQFAWKDVKTLSQSMDVDHKQEGSFHLLQPVEPITLEMFHQSVGKSFSESVRNPYELFSKPMYFLLLGSQIVDQKVSYNPPPWTVLKNVTTETFYTLGALFKGNLNPKWLSGPVGMMKVMHDRFGHGSKEALYWLGLISLNLGLLNLLPIPMLDGGHILFSLWEIVTRRSLSPKMLQRITMPFMVLLIVFFVFVTYHDIVRIFH